MVVVVPPWLIPHVPWLLCGGLAAAGYLPELRASLLPHRRSHDITRLV